MSQAQELDALQRLYEQQSQETTLNIEMRKALHQHAAAKGLELDVRLRFHFLA